MAFVLYKNLWKAILCIAPQTLEVDSEEPADRVTLPTELLAAARELERLGFSSIGSRREKPLLAPASLFYDFASGKEKVFAALSISDAGEVHLDFLTTTQGNGFVITANHRRPSREVPGVYLSGALEEVPADRIYRAHLRRVEALRPVGEYTQEARLAAAKAWASGPGRREIRLQNLQGLLWTAGTLGILAAAILGRR
jgi:hypothetical protein